MAKKRKMIAIATMPNNLLKEQVHLFREIGKHIPYKPAYTTIWGWAFKGRESWNGEKRCFLEHIFLPQGWATSIEAYERFVQELNHGRR